MQTQELTAFLKSYLDWVDEGAPEKMPYRRAYGLCINLLTGDDLVKNMALYEELREILHSERLSKDYPFNGSCYHYEKESESKACHLNQKRIDWVKAHVTVT